MHNFRTPSRSQARVPPVLEKSSSHTPEPRLNNARSVSPVKRSVSCTPVRSKTVMDAVPTLPSLRSDTQLDQLKPIVEKNKKKGVLMTFHELQQARERSVQIATSMNQAGLAVLTQLYSNEPTNHDTDGTVVFPSVESLRRQEIFEEKMSSKLDKLIVRDAARQEARRGMLEREEQDRQKRWLTVATVVEAAAKLMWEVRVARANKVLRDHFVLRIWSFIRRKRAAEARARIVEERQNGMGEPPSRDSLRKFPILAALPEPLLAQVAANIERVSFLAREYVVLEGQSGGEAYIMHSGSVQVLPARKPPPAVSSAVEPQTDFRNFNQPGWVIGHTMLVTEEPWESTIIALENTDMWRIPRKAIKDAVSTHGEDSLKEKVARIVDDRRATNMLRYRRMSETFVRNASPLFALWSPQGIARVLKYVRPVIFRRGDDIVLPGQMSRAIHFVVQGRIEVLLDGKRHELVKEGQAIGELAVSLGRKDKRKSARAVYNTDCWVLDRIDYQSISSHENMSAILPALLSIADVKGNERERSSRTPLAPAE